MMVTYDVITGETTLKKKSNQSFKKIWWADNWLPIWFANNKIASNDIRTGTFCQHTFLWKILLWKLVYQIILFFITYESLWSINAILLCNVLCCCPPLLRFACQNKNSSYFQDIYFHICSTYVPIVITLHFLLSFSTKL